MELITDRIQRALIYDRVELNLSYANLNEIPEKVFELTKLKSLNLIHNNLSSIPKSISKLKQLETLYLSSNNLKSLPNEIGELEHLKNLIVNNCKLEYLPDSLGDLTALEFCDVRINQLNVLPHTLGKLKNLETLLIDENPLKELQPELRTQTTKVILNFLKSKFEGDVVKLYEAKLIIVGEGEVGKTWLKERLIYNQIKSKNNTTEGIDISKWQLKTKITKDFRLNLWDFGGQEIYHSTHQFFLTERSFYLLVFDARKDYDVSSFGYWLKTIQLLSNNSPILIVLNKIDERIKNIDIEAFKEQFPNIIGYSQISALTGEGRTELIKIIKDNIIKLEHVGQKLPKSWLAVRKHLESLNLNFITYEYYVNICVKNNINEDLARDLSQYFHILGVFLHFQDNPILKGLLFLNPTWATTAVYKVLDDETVQLNKGKFNFEHLSKIWKNKSGYPEEYHIHLLELMKKFELTFQLSKSSWYIVPELLSFTKPQFEWVYTNSLQFELRYDFMPAGIMTRLIVRVHEIIKDNLLWKTGVILEEVTYIHSSNENEPSKKIISRALIIANDFDRKIFIYINGNEKIELLSLIRREINSIHKSLKNPPVTEIIICCCKQCSKDKYPEKIEFNRIKQYREKKIETFPCPKSGEQVNVSTLLGGFETIGQNTNEEIINLLKQIKYETNSDESFIKKANETIMLQPNIAGIGIDINKLINKFISKKNKL